ncbi:glycosyltransferase [Paracoccus aurantiacus]|uniref:Glycosyltransferase n=1 Tax=Paracoccus aurantiacus TaxID=2599412 RepID=A0A5C6S005_9RHOB|nr:glycosyltransferase [Paracoccus aurantiacus]TXB67714.1 glycosyltransferase [Paracoccus aurantiacus]
MMDDTAPLPADTGAARPDICVLIPVFRDQQGLTETLRILEAETFPFDIVVVDDGSPEVITAPEQVGNHRLKLLRLDRNRGIEHALNAGIEAIFEAGYRYISRLDCGDIPLEGRFEKQLAFMEENPDVGILGTWARCVNDDGEYLFTLRFPTDFQAMKRRQRYVPAMLHPTIMIRSAALKDIGVYSDSFRTAEDYDLFVRMARKHRIANLPEVLTQYIVSETGTTAAKRKRNLVSRLGVQRAYFGWADPHAYLGVARTLAFMAIPFDWMTAVKKKVWK